MDIRHRLVLLVTLLGAPLLLHGQDSYDCTDVEPEYYDPDYPYTDQELTALRSEELKRALGEMEYCQGEAGQGGGEGSGSGSGQGSGTGGGAGGSGGGGGSSSGSASGPVASSIGGTEAPQIPEISARQSREAREARQAVDNEEIVLGNPPPETDATQQPSPSASNNGAPPERIRRVDNDDAVAAQIRKAAEAETDPTRKQALWDEYYRYTGRPRPPSP